MSGRVPRRPAGQSGPAQSSQALEAFASSATHVDPEKVNASLASFLQGVRVEHSSGVDDSNNMEGRMAMRLRLLHKTNETTKLNALQDLCLCCSSCSDEHIIQFLPNLIEMIRVHAEHASVPVRNSAFQLLGNVLGPDRIAKNNEVKSAFAKQLSTVIGPWLLGMHDAEETVRELASSSFERCFSEEKRPLVVRKSLPDILSYAKMHLEALQAPVADDEGASGVIQGCIRSLAFVISIDPSAKPIVLEWMSSTIQHIFSRLAITGPPGGGAADSSASSKKEKKSNAAPQKLSLSSKSALIRAALLQLYTSVVVVAPPLEADHPILKQISTACGACINEMSELVVTRTWELLLQWCKVYGVVALQHFPNKFLDKVIDAMMLCEAPTVLAIHLTSMLPLAAAVSKVAPSLTIVDEFCGALVEKVKLLTSTSNISAKEMTEAWTALCECWELHHVRRIGTADAKDTVELFVVMMHTLVQTVHSSSKYARYFEPLVRVVGSSVAKAGGRERTILSECLSVLDGTNTSFSAVDPSSPQVAVERGLLLDLAAGIGAVLYAAMSAPGCSAAVSSLLDETSAFLNQVLSSLLLLSSSLLSSTAAPVHANGAKWAFIAVFQLAPSLVPCGAVRRIVAQRLLAAATASSGDADGKSTSSGSTKEIEDLLAVALPWRCAEVDETVQKLLAASERELPKWLTPLLLSKRCDDAGTFVSLLSAAIRHCNLHDVESLTQRLIDAKMSLTEGDVAGLRSALRETVRELLPADSSQRRAERHKGDDSVADGSSSSDDEESSTEDDDGEDGKDGSDRNDGLLIAERLVTSCKILSNQLFSSDLLCIDRPAMLELVQDLYTAAVSLSPRLHIDQHVSVKYLRHMVGLNEGDDDDDESGADPLLEAVARKRRWVSQDLLQVCHAAIRELATSRACSSVLAPSDIENVGTELFKRHFLAPSASPLVACAKLSYILIPSIVSSQVIFAVLTAEEGWTSNQLRLAQAESNDQARDCATDFGLRPHVSELEVSASCAVKASLLVHALAELLTNTPSCAEQVPHTLLAHVVRLAYFSTAFSDKTNYAITHAVAKSLMERTASAADASLTISLLDSRHLPTVTSLLAALCEKHTHSTRLHAALKAFVTAIAQLVVNHGNLTKFSNADVTAAFRYVDAATELLDCDPVAELRDTQPIHAILSSPSQHPTDALCNALVIYRHISTKPAIPDQVAQSLVAYCARLLAIRQAGDGARVLAELAYSRIISPSIYSEAIRVQQSLLCSCYPLHLFPASGKFVTATSPLPIREIARCVRIAATTHEGISKHKRSDDAMRNACNTVVFDAVCECVARLRTTKDADVRSLVDVAAFASQSFMKSLRPTDAGPLRASELATRVVAQTLVLLHAFLSAIPTAKYDAIGIPNIAALVTAVNYLAQITLVGNSLVEVLSSVIKLRQLKMPLKLLRQNYSSVEVERIASFRKLQQTVSKTTKQRLCLFTYLAAWSVAVSMSGKENVTAEGEALVGRNDAFALLDILAALGLCPTAAGLKRLEDSFWWRCGDDAAADELGFDLQALSRVTGAAGSSLPSDSGCAASSLSFETNEALARAAISVLTLLLQQPRLTSFVRDWIDTLDKRLRAQIQTFVKTNICPALIQDALGCVLSHSPEGEPSFAVSESLSVTVSRQQKFVDVAFTKDDTTVSIRILLPESFPLQSAVVAPESTKGGAQGVAGEKWRSWLLKMTMMLLGGSHALWDCIKLFGDNLEKHFEGVEPCPICYAVVSSVNNKLPEMKCSVCRNSSFHSSCLHTWWTNSGQTSCPMCRSPWIS